MKTFMAKAAEVEREWYVIDAAGQTLGIWRRRSREFSAARISRFDAHVDTGDFVVVVNASQLVLTGINCSRRCIVITRVIRAVCARSPISG